MSAERSVLVLGGGVAALAAASALVEHNLTKAGSGGTRFRITVMTSEEIWGGRASSWPGGIERDRLDEKGGIEAFDFRSWAPELPLNHGFHAVFDESTYVNFWYTLQLAGLAPDELKGRTLISNEREILVHEAETNRVCRLQVHSPDRYPYPFNSHLTEAAWAVFRHGGWSIREVLSFGLKVMTEVLRYRDFDQLADLDLFQRISFLKWCRDRGVQESVLQKMMFKFLFQGTYIAPHVMDATSGLMGLWVILRHMDAARWYYINGGITEKLIQPIADFIERHGVTLQRRRLATALRTNKDLSAIEGCESRKVGSDGADGLAIDTFDYYINTLPLDSTTVLLEKSGYGGPPNLLEGFPDIKALRLDERFVGPTGTVNLQAWFQEPGLLSDTGSPDGDYRNVIAGLEPLCVIVDYKNVLPMYRDDPRFTGSVLEINGSLDELQQPEHFGYFECDSRFGRPDEARTIEFARAIMLDLADRYKFPKLKRAVENDAFLHWPGQWAGRKHWSGRGDRIPPFLWKNNDPYNRFFVTGPGTLQYRPWVWRKEYPGEYLALRPADYPGPRGYPRNLFLAGDWTRNGFDVPCMEGAARSGRMAALSVIKAATDKGDPTGDPTKPEPTRGDTDFIQIFDPR